jgi:hypothetical protein
MQRNKSIDAGNFVIILTDLITRNALIFTGGNSVSNGVRALFFNFTLVVDDQK